MLTIILISYSLAAIVTGIITFCYIICDGNYDIVLGPAIFISLLAGAILPLIGTALIILSLLPIIIPCATAIYLFG